ncbi:hypothetical protein C8R46DRAFT_1080635 [Mycena filopes]|nr:hypothetical protein C8R46DRAFT_1080635 [Mycena filopes]
MERAQELHDALLLAREAGDVEELGRILQCIETEVAGTDELFKTTLPKDIRRLADQFPDKKSLGLRAAEVHQKLQDNRLPAKLEYVRTQWWSCPPAPPENPILLSFTDVTADHQPVGPENPWVVGEIQASLDEPFRDAFLRCRLEGNKKYRHPFLPSLLFDALLPSGLFDITSEDPMTVRQVVEQLGRPAIPFVRKDGYGNTLEVRLLTPFSNRHAWENDLPAWFPAPPAHWIDPVPPPSYAWTGSLIPSFPKATPVSYYKVPLLKFSGNGRDILPSVTAPPFITSDIYLPVYQIWLPEGRWIPFNMHEDAGLVRPSDVIFPPISLEQAKSLLGRIFRFCRHPLVINEPGKKKRKQKTNIFEFGAAWGWDPATCELHCVRVAPSPHEPFLLDLKGPATIAMRSGHEPHDPYAAHRDCCQWLGLVTTLEDRWVLEQLQTDPQASLSPPMQPTAALPDLDKKLTGIVPKLNSSPEARIFEVPRGTSLLFGDVMLAKAELDFELVLDNVRPGVWISRTDEDGQVLLHWVCDGSVDYEDIHPLSAEPLFDEALPWDAAGTFSVDSGVFGAITSSILDDDGPLVRDDYNAEVVLEAFMDLVGENSHTGSLAVPGGVVSAADDGGYEVLVRRNSENLICAVKITVL